MRGSIFETWAVSEIAKQRFHHGRVGGLSFYRDRSGTEVDLVIESPDSLTLVEAKSASTPSSAFLHTARKVAAHLKDQARCDLFAVYGGDQFQRRTHETLVPWHQLHDTALVTPD